MENDILKIEVAKQDLKETPEYWASESYETMIGKLQKLVEAKTGYPPFRNTKVIREVSFKITSRTTLGQIKELLSDIENDYNISCFQIAIDRGSNTAHLLFTWIHPRTALPVRFNNKTKVKLLSAYFVRRLHLDYPKDMTEWVRYLSWMHILKISLYLVRHLQVCRRKKTQQIKRFWLIHFCMLST